MRMCDYCGCRSAADVAALGEDHEALGWLATLVERRLEAGEPDAVRAPFAELATRLARHVAAEESGLFERLRAAGELVGYVEMLAAEHRAVAAKIATLGIAGPVEWPALAGQVIAELRAHIYREETDLFPASMLALASGPVTRH